VVDLGDLRSALALAEERVLHIALGLLHGLALLGERGFRSDMPRAARFKRGAGGGDLFADGSRRARAGRESLLALLGFGRELGLLGLELGAALAVALLRLRELQLLDLGVVPRLLLARDFQAAVLERCLALDALAFGALEPTLGVVQ